MNKFCHLNGNNIKSLKSPFITVSGTGHSVKQCFKILPYLYVYVQVHLYIHLLSNLTAFLVLVRGILSVVYDHSSRAFWMLSFVRQSCCYG